MAGGGAGALWRLVGRRRWGAVPIVLAVIVAADHAHRSDRPTWSGTAIVAAVVIALASIGAGRLLADPSVHWGWVAVGSLASAACIWAAVPETGPVIVTGGTLTGHIAVAALTGARWSRTAGIGAGAVLGWAALSGASGRPWAAVGGALCSGVAPWFAIRLRVHAARWRPAAGPWLLAGHCAVAGLAARWVGVVAKAGWLRVAVVAVAGRAVVAAMTRRA